MKVFFTFLLNMFFIGAISSQVSDSIEYFNASEATKFNKTEARTPRTKLSKENLKYHMEAGANFMSFGKGTNTFFSYVKPSVQYSITPKLSIHTGAIMGKSYSNVSHTQLDNFANTNYSFQSVWLFTEAEYKINQRLKISGSILYGLNSENNGNTHISNVFSPFQPTGNTYTLRGEYQVTDNLHIGFQITKRDNPYYNPYLYGYPYYNNMHSPFNQNGPFGW